MKNGYVAVLIKHYCHPPFETQAKIWESVLEFDPDTPIRKVFEQAYGQSDVQSVSLPKQE